MNQFTMWRKRVNQLFEEIIDVGDDCLSSDTITGANVDVAVAMDDLLLQLETNKHDLGSVGDLFMWEPGELWQEDRELWEPLVAPLRSIKSRCVL